MFGCVGGCHCSTGASQCLVGHYYPTMPHVNISVYQHMLLLFIGMDLPSIHTPKYIQDYGHNILRNDDLKVRSVSLQKQTC